MAGFDIRDMMNDIDEAPGKVWFWDLEKAVIDADRCVQCGVCVAACPTDSIGIGDDDLPVGLHRHIGYPRKSRGAAVESAQSSPTAIGS